MKLNNMRLLVSNFDETFLFYRDTLGFRVTWGDLGENYAQFQAGGSCELSIFSKQIMANVMGTSHLPAQVAVQDNIVLVFSVDDVDQYCQLLNSKGMKFVDQPRDQVDWGVRVVHFRDPEGNLLEFFSELRK